MKRYSKCYYTAQGRIVCDSIETPPTMNLLSALNYGPAPAPAPMKEFFSFKPMLQS